MTYNDYVVLDGFITKTKTDINHEIDSIDQERKKKDQTFDEKKKEEEQVEAKLEELGKLDYDFLIHEPVAAGLVMAIGILSSIIFVVITINFFQLFWPMGISFAAVTGFFEYLFFFSKKGIARSLLKSYKIEALNPHILENLNKEKKDLEDYFETYYEDVKKLDEQKKHLEAKKSAWIEAQNELNHFFNDKTTPPMEQEEPSMVEGKAPLQKK